MSQITKRALASALKELLEHKPLNKITIADITEQCGVNRQTFYYHFQDIYALLEWIYTTDAQRLLEGKRDGDTWQQGFLPGPGVHPGQPGPGPQYLPLRQPGAAGGLPVPGDLPADAGRSGGEGGGDPGPGGGPGLPGPLLQVRLCGADGGVDAGGHEGGARQAGEPGQYRDGGKYRRGPGAHGPAERALRSRQRGPAVCNFDSGPSIHWQAGPGALY